MTVAEIIRQDADQVRSLLLERLTADAPLRQLLQRAPALFDKLLNALADVWKGNGDDALMRLAERMRTAARDRSWSIGSLVTDVDLLCDLGRRQFVARAGRDESLADQLSAYEAAFGRLRAGLYGLDSSGPDSNGPDSNGLASSGAEPGEAERATLISFLERQRDLVCLLSTSGKPYYINQAGRELIGLADGQDIGAVGLAAWHGEATWQQLKSEVFPAVRARGVWTGAGQLKQLGTGLVVDVDISWTLVARASGAAPISVAGVYRDRRAEETAAQSLRESEALKSAILEMSLDPVVTMDSQGRIIEFNAAAERVFGRRRETAVGKDLVGLLFPGEERQGYQKRVERYFGAGQGSLLGSRTEAKAVRASGEQFPIEMAMVMGHVQGEPVCTLYLRDISERQRVERALKDSRALYGSLVETLPVNVYRKDRRGKISFANKRYCETLKRAPADVVGKTDYDLFPRDLADKYRRDDDDVLETGNTFEAIEEYFGSDGNRRHVHVLKTQVLDANGDVIGTQGIFWDVTKSVEGERALRDSQQRLQSILDNTTAVIYMKDRDGNYLLVNRSYERLFKIEAADILGRKDHELFPADLADAFRANDVSVMDCGHPCKFEEVAVGADGMARTYVSIKVPVIDANGQIYAVCGISSDITERKRAEEENRRMQQFLDSVLENVPIMLFVKDAEELRFERLNRAGEQLLGVSSDSILGKNDFDLFPREEAEFFIAKDREVLASGEMADIQEEQIDTADGQTRILHTKKIPLRDENGVPRHLVGISEDITVRRQQDEDLRRAKEAAEAASVAKSAFMANMSHEIRTPMNGILGLTELLLETRLNQEQFEYLTLVQDSANSLLVLINDILDFSKIESGRFDLDPRPFSMRDKVGDSIKTLAVRAHRKGLELATHFAPDVPDHIVADCERLRQVVLNLVGNAIKFTERGEVVLDVGLDSREGDRLVIHGTVTDTGIGIPRDKLATVFEAFEQADNTTTRRFGGTGLGLTISARLVELMGGQIWVESEPNVGSRFHFTFVAIEAPDHSVVSVALEPAALTGVRALIVDDNATNRRILMELLTNWRMLPVAVDSAAEAMRVMESAHAQGQPFPVVLLDSNMPDEDGFSLASRIAGHPELAGSTIMMLTSSERPGDLARCRELGVAAHLLKPIKFSELLEAMLVAHTGQPARAAKTPERVVAPPQDLAAGPAEDARRILLVEDSLVNTRLALGMLKKLGHSVVAASNGREAVETLERERFDLVLMDVQMPEMDGFQATALIREAERGGRPRTPIVAITAFAMEGDRERCLAAGMDGYLSKPIRGQDLADVIARFAPPEATTRAVPANMAEQVGGFPPDDAPGVSSGSLVSSGGAANSPPDGDGSIYSHADALQRVHGDAGALKSLAEAFAHECTTLLGEIRSALARSDFAAAKRAAHTIKGSAGIFVARQTVEAALRLEKQAALGQVSDIQTAAAALEQESARLLAALRQLS